MSDLKRIIDTVETLDDQKADIAAERKAAMDEAKAMGFDTKVIAMVLKRRKMDRDALNEQDALLEMYEREAN